jgi:hypothetical protein
VTRTVLTTNYGENFLRHEVRIEGDESPEEGQPGYIGLATLLQTLASQPDLLRHVGDCPISVHFRYDNGRWLAEATTIVARPPEG